MGIFKIIKGIFRQCEKFATGGGGISSVCHCEIRQRRIVAIRRLKIFSQNLATFLILFIFSPLNATELRTLCHNGSCEIKSDQTNVTNSAPFSSSNTNKIELKNAHITNFTNTSTINTYEFSINGSYDGKSYIEHFYNYGRIETQNTASLNTTTTGANGGYRNIYNYGYISGYVYLSQNETGATNLINYGEMGGLVQSTNASKDITIDNRGTINLFQQDNSGKKIHFKNIKSLTLKNYAMRISENASVFNNFDGNATDNSHLVLDSVTSVSFADASAKMILDFGGNFEAGKEYALNKLAVDTSGNNQLGVDFDRLVPRSDLFSLSQRGDYFIATLNTKASTIGNLYKSNVRTMNNFWTISNLMIYPKKSYHSQNLTRKYPSLRDSANLNISSLRASEYERGNPFALSSLRDLPTANRGNPPIKESLDSAILLKSYESFAYRSEAQNRRIQRQNKRNYNRKTNNAESSVKSQGGLPRATSRARNDNFNNSVNESQNLNADSANRDYYFILTPFVNYNSFNKAGNYTLSGFDYGFLTAFSAKIAESNHLGTHFIFSYGKLGDSKDKDLSINLI